MSTLESAERGAAGSHHAYGNPRGLDVLSERHDLKRRLASLEDWEAELKAEIAESKTRIASLEDHVNDQQHKINTLSLASEGYRKIRNRFLDVCYRNYRNVRDDVDPKGRQNIADGNEAAPYGDAVADAFLFTSGERGYSGIMLVIYGLDLVFRRRRKGLHQQPHHHDERPHFHRRCFDDLWDQHRYGCCDDSCREIDS
jgi:hypothetical protein